MIKDVVVSLRYCSRCKCSVPVDEWRPGKGLKYIRHSGAFRDSAIDRYVEPDENGGTTCDFREQMFLLPTPHAGQGEA